MLEDKLRQAIESQIEDKVVKIESLSGGCSYPSFVITTSKRRFFLKFSQDHTDVFLKEAHGLSEITKLIPHFCPQVLTANNNFLILDYISPERPTHVFWESLASNLAQLHRTRKPNYGFYEDNYIGQAPQKNLVTDDSISWADFFWKNRIQQQLFLNQNRHNFTLDSMRLQKLRETILFELSDYSSYPTLLHGDLWNGNIHCGEKQKAYLIDPAFYYGDREADIAMTECFGGFSEKFYQVYNEILPLDKGYEKRKHIYNLYHMLNHYFIFGASYKEASESIIQQIIST